MAVQNVLIPKRFLSESEQRICRTVEEVIQQLLILPPRLDVGAGGCGVRVGVASNSDADVFEPYVLFEMPISIVGG